MLPTLPLLTSLLLLPSALANGLYGKSSAVLSVDGQSYRRLIADSNHTSIVEFYAPWCGHCQNLKPAYEKAATSLKGLAKVAAVNCDAEENKPLCGNMGVQGFPTLKIVRPGKKPGRPAVEDYQGARSAKAIADAVVERIPNHVRRLKDSDFEAWRDEGDGPKAILFSEKGVVSALLKAIAVDFKDVMSIAQVRNKDKAAVDAFKVEKFPSLLLLPGGGKDPIIYDGEMKKDAMMKFLSQAASPNPDPAPKKEKAKKSTASKDKSKSSKASSSFSKASSSHASSEAQTAPASQTAETMDDASQPSESPNPQVDTEKPIHVPSEPAPPIKSLPDGLSLKQQCLNSKAGTCILALLPAVPSEKTLQAISSLSEIHHKHESAKRNLFPFYQLPHTNSQAAALRAKLSLSEDQVELVALNGKRGWFRLYPSSSSPSSSGEEEEKTSLLTQRSLEDWIDALRMGDLPKSPLPSGLVMPAEQLPEEPVKVDFGAHAGEGQAVDEDFLARIKKQMPEGMEFAMEEIDDEEYERNLAEQQQGEEGKEGEGHEEL
ncbi:putative disulfide isomerase [Hortaea werneckii]|uniref:protein disulfide-isomerase n=1 Tax=Hortaea werneckii TaxID=91943 RepID=A0A3M7EC22_HORWE|nr:putative disulfide isomerase [Hortaea werneckii]KAI7568355.1 putative disulfide isomerase [Hortaea werneckii]KAI7621147.1 putative disulfide isomerase [Hortaea werneckii]KAI7631660.1 putative disulfide isomerase [Hortaea werneckii]KAI7669534.1 putative disulfide isomerase [Hortaea werneckii]